MIIGARLPHTGDAATSRAVVDTAGALERAGFDSLWVSDHIAQPLEIGSPYPFAADGVARWSTQAPDLEALTTLAMVAATTERVTLGTAILLAPLRQPVLAAKQIATMASLAPGRIAIGVGTGWLKEEFEALGIPFARRGLRLEEWIAVVRSCWTGAAGPREGEFYPLPGPIVALPAPDPVVPLYTGGHSAPALRRAGAMADGWIGQQDCAALDVDTLGRELAAIRAAAEHHGREARDVRIVLRLVGSADGGGLVSDALAALQAHGVDEVILDAPRDLEKVRGHLDNYRASLA